MGMIPEVLRLSLAAAEANKAGFLGGRTTERQAVFTALVFSRQFSFAQRLGFAEDQRRMTNYSP